MEYQSILEAVAHGALSHPDKLCLVEGDHIWTYRQYIDRVAGAARYLTERGLRKGERVVVRTMQSAAFLLTELAVQLAGGVFVPVEKNAGAERIREIIAQTEATIFVANQKNALPDAEAITYEELCAHSERADIARMAFPKGEETSEILFTTGTTGKSKGIEMSFLSEVAVSENVCYGVEMRPDNVELIPMPVNHSFGLRRYYGNMRLGATVLLTDGVLQMDKLFRMMDAYRVTALALVPAALGAILKLSKDRLGNYRDQLRYIQIGTAPLAEGDKEKLRALLPNTRLYDFYGSTETGCACIVEFGQTPGVKGCIGRPTRHAEIVVTGEDGLPFSSDIDHPGLIAIRGAMSMKGYYKEPELTRQTVRGGYVYSSDMGYFDPEGRLMFLGRQGDVINCGGNKIAPTEIEEAAMKLPEIVDCACVPMPDEVMGQAPKLFVQMREGAAFDKAAVMLCLRGALEGFKVPKAIEAIEQIPRSFNGKLLRRELINR